MGDAADDAERAAEREQEIAQEPRELGDMRVGDLRLEYATRKGEDAPTKWKKPELVEAVQELRDFAEFRRLREEGAVAPGGGLPGLSPSEQAAADEGAETVEAEVVDEVDEAIAPGEVAEEVSKVLAIREQVPEPVSALPSAQEWTATLAIAEHIARTTFVPEAYRGRPTDVVAAILFGREIGMGPMMALRDIYMIDGRPALAAHRQTALLRSGGVTILESEATADRAWIRAKRRDTGEIMAVEFTMEEAKKIHVKGGKMLVDKDNWRNYPADMLWARAVGRLSRRLGPDLLGGIPPYVAEELADLDGWGVEYGADGALRIDASKSEQARPRETRQESAGRTETPHTFAACAALVAPYGPELGWAEWIKDACEALFKTREYGELAQANRDILLQKTIGACVGLRDTVDPGRMPPPSRAEIQGAWAKVLGGAFLPGPKWVIDPADAELGVPSYQEANGLPDPQAPEGAQAEPEAPAAVPETASGAEAAPETAPAADAPVDAAGREIEWPSGDEPVG